MNGRFVIVPEAILDDENLTANEKLVFFAIASYDWRDRGNGCTAAVPSIAKRAGLSERATQRAIKKLASGERYILTPKARFEGSVRLPNALRINPALWPTNGGDSATPPRDHGTPGWRHGVGTPVSQGRTKQTNQNHTNGSKERERARSKPDHTFGCSTYEPGGLLDPADCDLCKEIAL